jgi:hypothetical protein
VLQAQNASGNIPGISPINNGNNESNNFTMANGRVSNKYESRFVSISPRKDNYKAIDANKVLE